MISIIRYYLALASLMAVAVHGQEEGFFLGSLRTLNHLVSGDVFLLSEKVLEIRGFSYDGTAPAAFFWLDTAPNPTSGGRIAADGSPSLGCAATTSDPELPSLSNVNQRVEFPGETTIRDYLGGSLSVWCEAFAANFGDLTFPTSIPETALSVVGPELECSSSTEADSDPAEDIATDIPTFIPTPEGFNCEELNPLSDPIGNAPLQVRWRVNNNLLEIELIGRLPEGEYFGFGVSGSDEGTEMIGADAQVADFFNGQPRIQDIFIDQRAQCSGTSGVCRDDSAGFTNDILEIDGEMDEESGIAIFRYKKPISPTDITQTTSSGISVDQSLSVEVGVQTFVVWAIGPISEDTGNPLFHSTAFGREDKSIEFGRPIQDNCPLLYDGTTNAPTPVPPMAWEVPTIPDSVTEITAHIGPSGGARGYASITGNDPWGIAWFLNGDLIPQMIMRRGTKYTFKVSGGNDPSDNSNYHPFYLTTSERGGYQQLPPSQRMEETPLAGIEIKQQNDNGIFGFEATGVAPICKYEVTSLNNEAMLGPYEGWISSLDVSCAEDEAIISAAASITFTPDETTPDTIFYHCVTHFDLGWKITVIDAEAQAPFTTSDLGEATDLTIVNLEGQLEGSVLDYVVNLSDERAAGQDTITMTYEVPEETWVAIGFSTNGAMVGSEAVIGLPAEGTVQKYFLSSQSLNGVQPMPADQQTLIDASVSQEGGATRLTFTKILDEPGEIPINVGMNTFLGAYGFDNTLNIHQSRESFQVDLVSGGVDNVSTRKITLWKVHGWCAGIAWGLLSPLAIGAVLLKKWFKNGKWFRVHQTLNTLVVILTIIAFVVAIVAINKETPEGFSANHFSPNPFPHRTVGLIIFVLALVQAANGILRPHAPKDRENKTFVRSWWEIAHRILGYSLLGLSWYQVQSGIKIFSFIEVTDVDYLAVFWGVTAGIAVFIALGFLKIRILGKDSNNIEETKSTPMNEAPQQEEA